MITTITLNPSVDKTYVVKGFEPYALNRATRIIYNAGSKGINVSRVAKQLGLKTCVLGFVGGSNGKILLNELNTEGITEQLVRVESNTRLNVKIMDMHTKRVTEVNEKGEPISDNELADFMIGYENIIHDSRIIVISGSIPPGMNVHIYADLIRLANKYNKPVYIDCGGSMLKDGIKASPYCIKPNLSEFEQMLNKHGLDDRAIVDEARIIMEKYGIHQVVVTQGSDGAVGVESNGKAYKVHNPSTAVNSTVGAGDAFLAGLCYGNEKGMSFDKQLTLATSCASAKVTKEGNNVPSLIELLGYVEGCRVVEM